MFRKLKENTLKFEGAHKTATNNNSHHGRTRTSSTASASSQLSCSTGADTDALHLNASGAVAFERGSAIYNAPSGTTQLTDEAGRDSDAASITSSVFHSETKLADMQARFQQVHRLARGYKAKNKELMDACRTLERERDQLRGLMETNQTKARRRIDELQDQLELDKKAKQDVEVNYSLMLSEKDELIQVLRQQVALLKEGKDLPEDLKARIQAGHKRELERKRTLEQQHQELKAKVVELENQLQLTTVQLEEHTVKQNELQQYVVKYEKLREQTAKEESDVAELRRQLTDTKLSNAALEEQVYGLKEQLANALKVAAAETASTPPEEAEKEHESRMNELNNLRAMLETEQAARNKLEEELNRERQDTQAKLTLIEQLRASIDQCATRASDEASEFNTIKRELEEKTKLLAETDANLQLEVTKQTELIARLAETESQLTQFKQQTTLVAELEAQLSDLTAVKQECEALRQQSAEIQHLEEYVQTQLPKMKQVVSGVFPPDSTDPDVVSSSTATTTNWELRGPTLREGVEQLVSMVDRLGSELALQTDNQAEENRREAEHELAMTRLKETHLLQIQELEGKFSIEKSALDEDAQRKTQRVEELQNELGCVQAQLATLQLLVNDAEQRAQAKQDEADEWNKQCIELKQQIDSLQTHCKELEEGNAEVTVTQTRLDEVQSERDNLQSQLDESSARMEELQSELIAARDRVEQQNRCVSDTVSRLTQMKQIVLSVHHSVDSIRGEWTAFCETASNQLASDADRIIEQINSYWNSYMASCKQATDLSEETEHFKSEIARLQESSNKVDAELEKVRESAHIISGHLLDLLKLNGRGYLDRVKRVSSKLQSTDSASAVELDELDSVERSVSEITAELDILSRNASELSLDEDSPLFALLARLDSDSLRVAELEVNADRLVREDHDEKIRQAQTKGQLEVEQLMERCSRGEEKEEELKRSISELTEELDGLRASKQSNGDQLVAVESALSDARNRLSDTESQLRESEATRERQAVELQETVARMNKLESELTALQVVKESMTEALSSKESEVERIREERAHLDDQLSELNEKLDAMKATHAEEIQHIRLECDRKLDSQMHEINEERVKLDQSHQTQVQTLQESLKTKEKQWKQQLKDVKARLKQVLQESESLRKASVAATNKEQEVTNQLQETETKLSQRQSECDQLKERIGILEKELTHVRQMLAEVEAEARSPPANIIDEVREQYQKETESLKAEHALHTQDMQTEFQSQLRTREAELQTEFEQQMAAVVKESERTKADLIEARDQFEHTITEARGEVEALQARIQALETELEAVRALDQRPNSTLESVPDDSASELQRLREQVARLTARLQTESKESEQLMRSSYESKNDRFSEELTVQTEHIIPSQAGTQSAVYPPVQHEPLVPPKSSNWVEQLRNQILQAESIDSLHPAVRSNSYITSVSIEEYEALQCHNADLQNQLQQLSADFEKLRASCAAGNGLHTHHTPSSLLESSSPRRQFSFPPNSPGCDSSMGSLHELVEYEYLKNVLFEYMVGRETATLAKVLCSIMRFNSEQTKKVLHYEDIKSRTWTIRTVD